MVQWTAAGRGWRSKHPRAKVSTWSHPISGAIGAVCDEGSTRRVGSNWKKGLMTILRTYVLECRGEDHWPPTTLHLGDVGRNGHRIMQSRWYGRATGRDQITFQQQGIPSNAPAGHGTCQEFMRCSQEVLHIWIAQSRFGVESLHKNGPE